MTEEKGLLRRIQEPEYRTEEIPVFSLSGARLCDE
jgi:hypothetical protein